MGRGGEVGLSSHCVGFWGLPALRLPVSAFVPPFRCLAPNLNPGTTAFSGLQCPTHLRAGQFTKPFHIPGLTCPHTHIPGRDVTAVGATGLRKRSLRNRVARQPFQLPSLWVAEPGLRHVSPDFTPPALPSTHAPSLVRSEANSVS